MATRILTEQEHQIFLEAIPHLRNIGLVVDDDNQGGKETVDKNGNLLVDYFENNPQLAVTLPNIGSAVAALDDKLVWKNPAERAYKKLLATFSADEQAIFLAHYRLNGLLNNVSNNTKLLQYFRKHNSKITERNFEQIAYYAIPEQLDWAPRKQNPTPRTTADGRHSHAGETFETPHGNRPEGFEDKHSLFYADGRKNHAEDKQAAEVTPQSTMQADAKRRCEAVRGRTHAHSEQIARMYVMDGSEIDWVKTLTARTRAATSNVSLDLRKGY